MDPYGTPPMVCHVLLVETGNGLVLVDTGYGTQDCDDPARIGPTRLLFKPAFDRDETALRQVERLGFTRADVRHIVITHFDMDHIGGISDFPDAQIHVTSAEVQGAVRDSVVPGEDPLPRGPMGARAQARRARTRRREVAGIRRRQGTR